MHELDLALNNVQGLICHKNQPTNLDFTACFTLRSSGFVSKT